jgi:hypothetical protein
MITGPRQTRRELAHRPSAGVDVTLMLVQGGGEETVCVSVCGRRDGSYFEIPAEPYLALEICQPPVAYRDFSTVDVRDDRLAA